MSVIKFDLATFKHARESFIRDLSEEMFKQSGFIPTPLKSENQHKKQIYFDIENVLSDTYRRFTEGLTILANSAEGPANDIAKKILKYSALLDSQEKLTIPSDSSDVGRNLEIVDEIFQSIIDTIELLRDQKDNQACIACCHCVGYLVQF